MARRRPEHRISPCRTRGTGPVLRLPFTDLQDLRRECRIPKTRSISSTVMETFACIICQATGGVEDAVRLPCCHNTFGTTCLEHWLRDKQTKGRCPLCRCTVYIHIHDMFAEYEIALTAVFVDGDVTALRAFRRHYPFVQHWRMMKNMRGISQRLFQRVFARANVEAIESRSSRRESESVTVSDLGHADAQGAVTAAPRTSA